MTIINSNFVEKAYLSSGSSLQQLCNYKKTNKHIFPFFVISLQYTGIGLRGVTGPLAVKRVAMGHQLEHGPVTIPLQLMVEQVVLVLEICFKIA